YHLLNTEHGTTGGDLNGMQWLAGDGAACGTYLRATPASAFADTHYLEVAQYLAANYDIDGIHLDHIRYGGGSTSCDPVSQAASGVPCFTNPPAGYESYAAWQRAQVNGTVWKFYQQIVQNNPDIALSAAVWPIYYDYWNWGINTGYGYYYQDSKAWIQGGYIDIILPMIYGSSFWNQSVWETLVTDFQADSSGRFVVPGIGANFDDFNEIETRINMGRQIGTPGHAIFSYGQLKARQYFDDLRNGPYAEPASVPVITWR
ncbi:MAG: family 10 glycosylhydrolase, partial [Candidatus Promineifilaceae bacterium]